MSKPTNWLHALILFAAGCLTAPMAIADGPFPPDHTTRADAGQCDPIKGSKACKQTFQSFTVNKADGSGSTKVSLIEERSLSYTTIAKTASTLGEPLYPKNDSYTKTSMTKWPYFGVMLTDENKIIEPPLYRHILPVSDKVGLAIANEVTRFYGKDSGYYTPTNKYYWVNLDGKLTKPERPGMDPGSFYYVGGYGSLPAQVFEFLGRDDTRGTATLRQYDGYGKERAVFDNIVLHKRKDNYDTFEVSFYVNSQYDFVVSALHPDTGEPASLWFKADGSVIGYKEPMEPRSMLQYGTKDKTHTGLVRIVGKLPVLTDLRDDTLYHPVDINGEKVPAPDNFIGMTRLFQSRGTNGDLSTAQNYYTGWLLVYALPTGYGFKISDRATGYNYPGMVSAYDVLYGEKYLKMFSGFGYSRVADGSFATIVRPFDRYEEDGLTPAERALPAQWHRAITDSSGGMRLTAAMENVITEEGYDTSSEAFEAIRRYEVEWDQQYAAQQEIYRQQRAAEEAAREIERVRREAELKAYYAAEAKKEAEYAAARNEYRPKTGVEEFNERMALMENHWNRTNKADLPVGTEICYDMGDGSDFCFTY